MPETRQKAEPHRYCLTGGGTGGHVYPAIAIADELRRRRPDAKFLYVGVRGRAEEKIVPQRGYPITFVRSSGLPAGRNVFRLAAFAMDLLLGTLKAFAILARFRPEVVVGVGGYVSAPVMFAAIVLKRLRLWKGRTFIHEQNVIPGRLNRLVAGLADVVATSFAETAPHLSGARAVRLGYPVRSEVGRPSRPHQRARLGLAEGERLVMVFGGSLGARTINKGIVEALPLLRAFKGLRIIHATGRRGSAAYDPVEDVERTLAGLGQQFPFYERRDYFEDIQNLYAAADLAVCRAGAGTILELALCGLPALLVPKTNLPGDHQVRNARAMAAAGAARVLYERAVWERGEVIEKIDPAELAATIKYLLSSQDALTAMAARARKMGDASALQRICDCIEDLSIGRLVVPDAAGQPPSGGDNLASLGGEALVSHLERLEASGRELDADDLMYVRYRTDGYLASAQWQARNVGVKLVGLSGFLERIPLLLSMLADRRRVSLPLRLLGGDFVQVGFIRRNIMRTIGKLGVYDARVRQALLSGLKDPYFEVRAAAAHAVGRLSRQVGENPEMEAAVRALAAERNFEVVSEALRCLGMVSGGKEALRFLRGFYYHPNWQVRDAAVEAMLAMVERGILSDPSEVSQEIDMLLITCSGFIPTFPLKERINRLMAAAGRCGGQKG